MSTPETFKVDDKVKTTKGHDQFFGFHKEGIIERVDGEYIELYTRLGDHISLHTRWIEPYEGDFNWFYRRKLV
ncbi:hypothetical protein KAU33_09270 [Candidatus Dependentiae bacterium]|nr:hypothetical protein [Candidatus Dependentiae bacterium]